MSAKTIYKTLAPFFDAVDGIEEKALKFTAPGYMDLCIEALGYNDHEGRPVYSVAHYGEQNGDLMRDPYRGAADLPERLHRPLLGSLQRFRGRKAHKILSGYEKGPCRHGDGLGEEHKGPGLQPCGSCVKEAGA